MREMQYAVRPRACAIEFCMNKAAARTRSCHCCGGTRAQSWVTCCAAGPSILRAFLVARVLVAAVMVSVLSVLLWGWPLQLAAHAAAEGVGTSAVLSAGAPTSGGGSTAVWASHPVASNQTLMLQIYGASKSSKVAVETWSESTATWHSSTPLLTPESASASGLAVVLPGGSAGNSGTKEYSAYMISVDGGKPVPVNTPEIWWTLGDAGDSATNGGNGWVRLFGRSVALGGSPSQLKLTHSLGGKSVTRARTAPGF